MAPTARPAAISAIGIQRFSFPPIPLMPVITRPKVRALRITLTGSRGRAERGVSGRDRAAMTRAATPIGTLIRKSQCQEATDRIAAATLGLPAEQTATTTAILPTPCPARGDG